MHADGVGDDAQVQRPQMLHAVGQKGVLLAHDLGRNFQDRAGALIEGTGQPRRRLKTFGEEILFLFGFCRLRHARVIALIDEHARQRIGIELDIPRPVGCGPHEYVGNDRLHHPAAEGEPGLRVEAADLGDHVGQIFFIDGGDALQDAEIAFGQ